MLRDAWLIATKDLQVELRGRVTTNQVAPFSILVLVLFGFALDPQMQILQAATPGLFWVAVLLSMLLTVQRAFAVESADGVSDRMLLSGLNPAGVFLGKTLAIGVQLLVLEALLLAGVAILYSSHLNSFGLIAVTCLVASVGLAAAGAVYGALVGGVRGRETLLPLLLLPVVSPVLIGATTSFQAAFDTAAIETGEGWRWVALLGVFAVIYLAAGIFSYGPLLEES